MPENGAHRSRSLASPGLIWTTGRVPMSSRFGDIYYSRDGGLDEARYVFLNGCDLPNAWKANKAFTICELGFGTGLNFLATWEAWHRAGLENSWLHYIAVEGFPLLKEELGETLMEWPQLKTFARGLMHVYPQPQPGFHRVFPKIGRNHESCNMTLTLLFGESSEMLRQLEASVDAWFLDGFTPDKNPGMWSADVFAQIARLSHTRNNGTNLATYSTASRVRSGLNKVGFDTNKAQGFGRKRTMLRAQFNRCVKSESLLKPWFSRPPSLNIRPGHAAIIGAGIAGTSIAFALNRRGWQTTIIERRKTIAAEASGNPMGIIAPRLTASENAHDGRFYAAAWRFLLSVLEVVSASRSEIIYNRCGALQLAIRAEENQRQKSIADTAILPKPFLFQVSSKDGSDIAGHKIPYSALYFPHGGWLNPPAFCAALARMSSTLLSVDAISLSCKDGVWKIADSTGRVQTQADVVILANGIDVSRIPFTSLLPLAAMRGQISMISPTDISKSLRTVLSFGPYITPPHLGAHCVGATYDSIDYSQNTTQVAACEADDARNIEAINSALPDMLSGTHTIAPYHRAAIRCTSPDHLPIAGPVPDQFEFLRDYADLRHGHPWTKHPKAAYQKGLYVLTGLGSRGLTSAPLAAETIAAHISNEPWPLERDLITAMHPGRFLIRDLKRRNV